MQYYNYRNKEMSRKGGANMNIVELSNAYENWKKNISKQIKEQSDIRVELITLNSKLGFEYSADVQEILKNVTLSGSFYNRHVADLATRYYELNGEYKAFILFENELKNINLERGWL